jgi:hypothetical protein
VKKKKKKKKKKLAWENFERWGSVCLVDGDGEGYTECLEVLELE